MTTGNAPKSRVAGRTGPKGAGGASTDLSGVQRLVLEGFPHPKLARALSPNGRAHWQVERKAKACVSAVVVTALAQTPLRPATGPVRIICRWIFPTRARRDLDNLSTGVVKRVIDTLVEKKVLVDDDSTHVVAVTAEAVYEKGRRALEIVMEDAA